MTKLSKLDLEAQFDLELKSGKAQKRLVMFYADLPARHG